MSMHVQSPHDQLLWALECLCQVLTDVYTACTDSAIALATSGGRRE